MPQEIRVVQCFQCEMFQVDIVKMSNKWQCKICQAKQSLRKVIFRGSGADCRQKVQELNKKRGELKSEESNQILDLLMEGDDFISDANVSGTNDILTESNDIKSNKRNKWESFLDDQTTKEASVVEESRTFNSVKEPFQISRRSKWSEYL